MRRIIVFYVDPTFSELDEIELLRQDCTYPMYHRLSFVSYIASMITAIDSDYRKKKNEEKIIMIIGTTTLIVSTTI